APELDIGGCSAGVELVAGDVAAVDGEVCEGCHEAVLSLGGAWLGGSGGYLRALPRMCRGCCSGFGSAAGNGRKRARKSSTCGTAMTRVMAAVTAGEAETHCHRSSRPIASTTSPHIAAKATAAWNTERKVARHGRLTWVGAGVVI